MLKSNPQDLAAMADDPPTPAANGVRPAPVMSRRHLFELGGATVGLAGLLAACSEAAEPAAGRVGNAPVPTDLPRVETNDAVFLLAGLDGLGEQTAAMLTRFTDDHTATADALATLTTETGGEPYACANDWLDDRQIEPALDHLVGRPAEGGDAEVAPTDDADRDALALINGLETLAAATYQGLVEKLSTPGLRAAVIPFGAASARRAAAIAVVAAGDEDRFVSPALVGGDVVADDQGFLPAYAIPSRFGQLTPIEVAIGALDSLQLRYTATFETPADNAYRYADLACPD
jgi:hypothetical protein